MRFLLLPFLIDLLGVFKPISELDITLPFSSSVGYCLPVVVWKPPRFVGDMKSNSFMSPSSLRAS
jgi:hypothetical protein